MTSAGNICVKVPRLCDRREVEGPKERLCFHSRVIPPYLRRATLKDKDQMLRFYDFPAEHWRHIRSTNVIESTFATVRLRTYKTKGCLSRKTALTMVFKLIEAAEKKWHRLHSYKLLPVVLSGVEFIDGVRKAA